MTRYLLTVHGPAEIDETANYGSKDEMDEAFAETEVFNDDLRAKGYWIFGGGLATASQAVVVDGQGAAPLVIDGPYLEAKELLAGFWVIDVPDHDVALEVTAGASRACRCRIELRAFDAWS